MLSILGWFKGGPVLISYVRSIQHWWLLIWELE
jgi:hypothetical protein